jgi:ATP-binding cassette subfamily C protein CydC
MSDAAPTPFRSSEPLLRMIALARPRGARFALGVLAGAAATASGTALLVVAAWLIATAATSPPLTALSVAIVATRALGVTRGVARYLERLVTHDAALRTLSDVRARVYERLARTEPVHRFRTGDLVTRLVSDTDATQDLLVRGLTPPLAALVTGAGAVAVSTALLAPGGIVLAAGLVLGGVAVPLVAAAAGRGPGRRRAAGRAALSTALVDTLHGAPDLVAYGAMPAALARVDAADGELTRVERRDTLLLGVAAVRDGTLAPVPMAVLVLTALAAFEIVAPLPGAAARLGTVRAAGARLFDVLDTPPALVPRAAAAPAPAADGLRVRGLRVRYGPDEPWALDGVDLDVPPGRRIAVVGPSGSGKSTLAAVLFRFRDPDDGTVHMDGDDVTALPADTVRARVTGMPQDPHLFASTVRENLRMARPDATDADLRAVLARVGLDPDLLDTEVGTHGARLSGGMRRRLALARALLVPPAGAAGPLLVLDEPTTHLDPDTRTAVLDDLLAATAGRSLLLITHDLDALDRMDEVVVLVDGRVRQRGTPTELRERRGWFRNGLSSASGRPATVSPVSTER